MPESVPPTALPRLPTNPTVGAAALTEKKGKRDRVRQSLGERDREEK